MAKEQFSKKDLEAVATDLNKIFEQPIPTGRKATVTSLKKDLLEAAQEIQADDNISDKSKEILTALGAKLPEEKPKKDVKKASPQKKKENGSKEKSRFGHKLGSQAGQIDDMVFAGATMKEMADKIGISIGRIKGHLAHLHKDKGVKINEKDGKFQGGK